MSFCDERIAVYWGMVEAILLLIRQASSRVNTVRYTADEPVRQTCGKCDVAEHDSVKSNGVVDDFFRNILAAPARASSLAGRGQ